MEASSPVLFDSGLNCAQAVFGPHASAFGIETGVALRLASGFGAGMGRRQEVCGAVSGALLVLGLRAGYAEAQDKQGKERVYGLARDLQRRFAAVHGSVLCRELLNVDLTTVEGQAAFGARNLADTVCRGCVETAERLLNEIGEENNHD